MEARTYEELLTEKVDALRAQRRDLHPWQCRLEAMRLYPGLFQAVHGQTPHERLMGAVDFHLAQGCSEAEAYRQVARLDPELAREQPAR